MATIDEFIHASQQISSVAHWRVQVWPLKVDSERLGPMSKLKPLIRECSVSLRGWNFPHVTYDSNDELYHETCYWSKAGFGESREVWKCCTSGLFVGLFKLRELDPDWSRRIRDLTHYDRFDDSLAGVVEFRNQIWTITEAFEFAARYAKKCNFEEGLSFEMILKNIQNFGLGTSDSGRHLLPGYICRDNCIRLNYEVGLAECASEPHKLSLAAIQRFLRFFDLLNVRVDIIQSLQQEFYQMRYGNDRIDIEEMNWEI